MAQACLQEAPVGKNIERMAESFVIKNLHGFLSLFSLATKKAYAPLSGLDYAKRQGRKNFHPVKVAGFTAIYTALIP